MSFFRGEGETIFLTRRTRGKGGDGCWRGQSWRRMGTGVVDGE